jgi:predicted transcriptional regulator
MPSGTPGGHRRGLNYSLTTSAESSVRVLSERNRAVLGIIAESTPELLARLEEQSGRKTIESVADPADQWNVTGSFN